MIRTLFIACAAVLGAATTAAADDSTTAANSQTSSTAQGAAAQPESMQLFDTVGIYRETITDKQGKALGKLDRLLIDSQTGRVRFAVVQVDREWSLNDPEVIVPWKTLQITHPGPKKEYGVMIDTDRNKLLNAPHFDQALVHQLSTGGAGQHIYAYWGVTWQDETNRAVAAQTTATESKPAAQSAPAPQPAPASATSSSAPATGPHPATPVTTTDGSTGAQSIGNSGTSDSPATKTPASPGREPLLNSNPSPQPRPETEPKETEPNRSLGGDKSD